MGGTLTPAQAIRAPRVYEGAGTTGAGLGLRLISSHNPRRTNPRRATDANRSVDKFPVALKC